MFDEVLFEQRLNDFKPDPLVPAMDENEQEEPIEIHRVVEDENNIDLAKINYLDLLNNDELKKAAEQTIREYGVGTCGPRAFYGTTDVHLELEESLSKFLHMEESIVYSYGFVAISSSIAAYCKKNDTIFVDENANFAIEQGWVAAKSKVVKFAHNNPNDLKEKVQEVLNNEKKRTRKFLIIEGISWKTGKLCPLPEFLQVAEEFKIRVFLEESYTLGVFGDTGRGLLEYYNIDPTRVDMSFGTLEGAIGSIGGYCSGSFSTIEHQRLSGSGYIFSASLPTHLVKVIIKGIEILQEKPKKFMEFSETFHRFLTNECDFPVISDPKSPFKIISIKPKILETTVHQYCAENGIHFIKNENGLVINLNIRLATDKEKLSKVYAVFREASKLLK